MTGEGRIYRASCIGGEIRFVAAEPDVAWLRSLGLGQIVPDLDRDHGWILRLGDVSYLQATQAILSLGPPYLTLGDRPCGNVR